MQQKKKDTEGQTVMPEINGLHRLANGVLVDSFREGDVLIENETCSLVITSVKEAENGQEIIATSIPKKLTIEVNVE